MKDPNKLTIADYRKAIQKIQAKITIFQKQILEAHAGLREASLGDIADEFSQVSAKGIATTYGRFARKIGLELDNSPHRPNERHYWMELICAKSPNKNASNQTVWIIRERFVKALEADKII